MMRWAACLLLLGAAWASSVEIRPAADAQALPGEYATMLFEVWGQGEVQPRALVPAGWQPLPLPEKLNLAGKTLLALTVRVPELTPAGSKHPLILQVWDGDRLLNQATASVEILLKADLILFVENKQEARLGEPITYRVTVLNRGNARDHIFLEAKPNTGESYLSPSVLELDPGAEGTATLTLQIGKKRQVSPGYTMITWVRARSDNGDLERKVRVTTNWLDPYTLGASGPDPTLRVGLSGSLGLGSRFEDGHFTPPVFRYSLQPSLRGRLSDFVKTSVSTSTFGGESPEWWPAAPSNLVLGIRGSSWDAAVSATNSALELKSSFKTRGWRYGVGLNGRYDLDAGGFSINAVSTQRTLNLQLSANIEAAKGSRHDYLSINYNYIFNKWIALRLGGSLNGVDSESYTLIGTLRQGLSWQGKKFSALQSISASPQLGLYSLTVTGGTRSVYPLGVRGTAHLQQQPEGLGWKASGSIFATPWPRSSLRITTAIENAAGHPLEIKLNPSLAVRPQLINGMRSSFSLGYKLRYAPADETKIRQALSLSARLAYGNFAIGGNGTYTLFGPPNYSAQIGINWHPWSLTTFQGKYSVKVDDVYSQKISLDWQQYWGAGFASQLSIEHDNADRLSLSLARKSLFGNPIGIAIGYALSDPDGLGHGKKQLTHKFSVRLGYNFAWKFTTPETIVNIFGGRKVGRVRGIAFIDTNLNGVQDDGELPVPNLIVHLGSASAKTDAHGRYELQTRPGKLNPVLEGLSAKLDLYQRAELKVKEGKEYLFNLPLAPTAQLPLLLFHDANHNGVQDEDERGIAYGGIRLSGPITRTFRTDERGRVLATGVLPGSYTIAPDPELLPPRFHATIPAIRVNLQAGKDNPVVRVGAAPPPKQVRTTYDPGKLAIFASLSTPIVAAGADFEVRALARGGPERVWLNLDGKKYILERQGGNVYTARIRLAHNTPAGPLTLKIRASRESEIAEALAIITVVKKQLYSLDPVKLRIGKPRLLKLDLLFKARSVRLIIGEEAKLEMKSEDGYHWTSEWSPARAGVFEAQVVADGEELSQTRITVLPALTGEK